MKEVKSPKKPLFYYYGIVLLIIIVFNVLVTPMLTKTMVKEVDYGTFMSKIEDKKIDDVQIEDNQILFTDKDDKNTIYKTGVRRSDYRLTFSGTVSKETNLTVL